MLDIHQPGAIWENWVLDGEIGHGAYGTVYRAHRINAYSHAEQLAAVKHIPVDGPGLSDDIGIGSNQFNSAGLEAQKAKVSGELTAMVNLRGKAHIVSYEDHREIVRPDGDGFDVFLRMELLTSLNAMVEKEGLPSRMKVARLGMDIGGALEVLEKRHYLHRDIKPANIFVDSMGDYKLGDFGTARILNERNMASTKAGTLLYMAPEVVEGLAAYDWTVDLYSLGIVLYRLLNDNFLPFMDEKHPDSTKAVEWRTRGVPIPPPRHGDEELNRIVFRCIAHQPQDRYRNATELVHDL